MVFVLVVVGVVIVVQFCDVVYEVDFDGVLCGFIDDIIVDLVWELVIILLIVFVIVVVVVYLFSCVVLWFVDWICVVV